jgi:hypothetical protein
MSQSESPSEKMRQQRRELLQDLARQAEARKQQVKQMLAQCADDRNREVENVSPGLQPEPPPVLDGWQKEIVQPEPQAEPLMSEESGVEPVSVEAEQKFDGVVDAPMLDEELAEPDPVVILDAVADEPVESEHLPEAAITVRMDELENRFAQFVEEVSNKLDVTSRLTLVEEQSKTTQEALEELAASMAPIESKFQAIQENFRAFDEAAERWNGHFKSIEESFLVLGRDSQELGSAFELLAGEFRATQQRVAKLEQEQSTPGMDFSRELQSFEDRLGRLETDVMGAVDLLQSSEQELTELAKLRNEFHEMEEGFQRVLKVVSNLERPLDITDTAAEREATANVLASLTKLVQGMRASQSERSLQETVPTT